MPSFGQLQRKHLLRSEIDNVENLLRVELPGKKIGKLKFSEQISKMYV